MTTIGAPTARSHTSPASRILAVTRLHFANRFLLIYQPLMLLGGIFILNLAVWLVVVAAAAPDNKVEVESHLGYSGAVSSIFIYALVVAVQAVSRTFPFSLGFGVTRRNFYFGSVLTFLLLAVLFSIVLTVMSSIEIATDGWGIGGRMFAPEYFTSESWPTRFVMDLLLFLFCLFVGAAASSVWVRWRVTGLLAFFGILAVILVGAVALMTLGHLWGAFGDWAQAQSTLELMLWLLVPIVISGIVGYLVLRRATPRG